MFTDFQEVMRFIRENGTPDGRGLVNGTMGDSFVLHPQRSFANGSHVLLGGAQSETGIKLYARRLQTDRPTMFVCLKSWTPSNEPEQEPHFSFGNPVTVPAQ